MPRPTIDEQVVDRLTDAVDARTKVPAEHLGIEERLAFVLDELEEVDQRADHLAQRVDRLEEQLEEARAEPDETGVATGTEVSDLDLGSNRGGTRGPF